MTPTPMQDILSGIADVTTAIVSVISKFVSLVVGTPLLLIPVLLGFVYGGFKLFKALRRG